MPGLNHQAEARRVRSNFRPPMGRSAKSSLSAHSSPSLFSRQRFQHQTNPDLVDLRTDSLTNCFFSLICAEARQPFKKNKTKIKHTESILPKGKSRQVPGRASVIIVHNWAALLGQTLGGWGPTESLSGWMSHQLELLTRWTRWDASQKSVRGKIPTKMLAKKYLFCAIQRADWYI